MRQRRQRVNQVLPVAAHLDAQRALACSGQHRTGFERGADPGFQPQALQARSRQHDGVVLAFVQFAQAGVEVAAQGLDLQVGPQGLQQHLAAQARCAHHGTQRQRVQVLVAGGDKGIARVFALHHAGQGKALGQLHGYVLERMHGNVGAPFFQCYFQLFHKQALAAYLAEGLVQNLVALGGHAQQLHAVAPGFEQRFDMLGLPQCKATFARGDDDGGRWRGAQVRNLFVIIQRRRMLACARTGAGAACGHAGSTRQAIPPIPETPA